MLELITCNTTMGNHLMIEMEFRCVDNVYIQYMFKFVILLTINVWYM